jgi:predicted kinase
MTAVKFHLVCGPTGAGKTTRAIGLAEEFRAVRFSIDEWMARLFWADTPLPIRYDWTVERIGRCEAQMLETALQVARRGGACVLDFGFSRAQHRQRVVGLLRDHGFDACVHVADAPPEERWRRVQQRNAERGETYALEVTREMFDFMEGLWEPPGTGEGKARAD